MARGSVIRGYSLSPKTEVSGFFADVFYEYSAGITYDGVTIRPEPKLRMNDNMI